MPAGMTITRFSPSIPLMPFIREYIVIEARQELLNNLVPDTFMAMAIRIKGATGIISGNELTPMDSGIITGLTDTTRAVGYTADSANLVIAFSPVPAHELFSKSIPAGNIFPPAGLHTLSEKLQEAITHEARIQQLELFLLNKLKAAPSDPMINRAVELIRKHKGIIRVKDLAAALHVSQDPFEKKFRARIGSSPKKFASITRIRNLINNYASYTSLTDASYEAGFYDQSHFIKEFRQFTGKSPSEFFSAPPAW